MNILDEECGDELKYYTCIVNDIIGNTPPKGSRFFHFDTQNFQKITALGVSAMAPMRSAPLWEILDLPLEVLNEMTSTKKGWDYFQ